MIPYILTKEGKLIPSLCGPIKYYPLVSQVPFYKSSITDLNIVELPEKTSDKYRLLKRSVDGIVFNQFFSHKFLKEIVNRQILPIFNLTHFTELLLVKDFRKLRTIKLAYSKVCRYVKPLVIYTEGDLALERLVTYFFNEHD